MLRFSMVTTTFTKSLHGQAESAAIKRAYSVIRLLSMCHSRSSLQHQTRQHSKHQYLLYLENRMRNVPVCRSLSTESRKLLPLLRSRASITPSTKGFCYTNIPVKVRESRMAKKKCKRCIKQ